MRARSVRATTSTVLTNGDKPFQIISLGTTPKKGVRKPSNIRYAVQRTYDAIPLLAHPSNGLVAQLNARWRVVYDPLQWVLQRRKGNPRSKSTGWASRSFCSTREALLRRVREYCGEVEPRAFANLAALPEHHAMQNLDVHGTDQAQVEKHSEPLAPQGLGGLQA